MKWELIIVILLIIPQVGLINNHHNIAKPLPLSPLVASNLEITLVDEQLFIVLNSYPVTTNMSAYVKVIAQSSVSGYGPAYLINAITNNGWWYQLGVAYNWPYSNGSYDPGFHLIYMVWASNGSPAIGPFLVNFNGQVNSGDEVLLEMYFSGSNIILSAYDIYTGATASVSVKAEGTTFTTSNNLIHGFITGLMTEWYHSRPYYGGEQGVIYKLPYFSSYFTLGADEFQNSSNVLFYVTHDYLAQNNYTFYNLSFGGAFEASNGVYFVTGDLYPIFLNYKIIGGNFTQQLNVTYQCLNYIKTSELPSLIFANPGTNLTVPTLIVKGFSRIILINQTPIEVLRSGNLTLYYQLQYYVNVNIKVNSTVNNMPFNLTSGWYNASSNISISNYTYYNNKSRLYIISVYPSFQFTLKGPVNISIIYVLQYYVELVSSLPVFGSINGTNTTISSNWFNANTIIQIYNKTFYPNNLTRIIITKISPSNIIIVNKSYTVFIKSLVQYFVKIISPIRVFALINGSNTTLSSNWYNANTSIQVENITYYGLNDEYRYLIVNILPSQNIIIKNPIIIKIIAVKQYPIHVISPITVFALINGTNETLPSFFWINSGTQINIENITYYINNTSRLIITNISPYSSFVVNNPINISITTLSQYFLNISSNHLVYAYVNGKNVTLNSNWYDNGTEIIIYRIWYFNSTERQYLVSISVNGKNIAQNVIIINQPIFLRLSYVIQYYINLTSNIPVKAIVNTSLVTFKPNWYDEGTPIMFLNSTYYVTNDTRYIILSITPMNFTVNHSLNVIVKDMEEFLVKANNPVIFIINNESINTSEVWVPNGEIIQVLKYYYISTNERIFYNTTNYTLDVTKPLDVSVIPVREYLVNINGSSMWLPYGSIVTLSESLPIYEQGKWVGTYNVSNGANITITSPVTETFVKSVNGLFVGIILLIIGLILIVVLIFVIRSSKPKF
ncbi:MAG: hypothetical protein QXY03_06580 [Saccharolobus sp.]